MTHAAEVALAEVQDRVSERRLAEVLEQLPELVAAERQRRGLTLRSAAEEIGFGFNSLSRLERRQNGVSLDNAILVLRWLAAARPDRREDHRTAGRLGTLDDDERCHRCGGENIRWSAPSPLWNRVMRGNDINGEPRYGDLVCIRCFIVLAFEARIDGRWRVTVDPEPEGLVYETPSGRVWNSEELLWVEPRAVRPAGEDCDRR